jgi:Holin of 3TMs, for gene-transfer release
MNFLSALFNGGDLVKSAGEIADKLFTSDDEKAERKNEAEKTKREFDIREKELEFRHEKLQADNSLSQIEVNKIEASNTSLFVSGWRPAVGWVCCLAMAYSYIIEPLLRFICKVFFSYSGDFPVLDLESIYPVLFGLLGLGAMRMNEKIKGVHSK